jgi:hypothetical protein
MTTKKTTTKKSEAEVQGNPLDIALDEARNMMTHIERDSRNDHFKFDYASGDNMLAACRKVLSECGILVILEQVQHTEVAGRLVQQCAFLVKHIESGEMMPNNFTCPVVGNADDKASFGCNTGIWKYYLRGLLMLPMGDFDEPCAREDDSDAPVFDDHNAKKWQYRRAAIEQVKNLYEEMDTEWVEKVNGWIMDNHNAIEIIVPEKMTDEELETIIERAKK